jgi:small neutral amino acid transporter SnatA (MarC family)
MTEIISAAVLLILIMDPLGNLPIFMSVLKHTEPKRRRAIMIRELLIALGVMFIFLFAGEKILAFLNLRAETVSISGGIILFLIAIKMIFPSAEGSSSGLPAGEEPFIQSYNPGADLQPESDVHARARRRWYCARR